MGITLWRTHLAGGYPVDNPLTALLERIKEYEGKKEEENEIH
jgi:hypothetical protein